MIDRHSPRPTEIIDGVEHIRCSSCLQMFPNDRKHFYLQKDRQGNHRPHSWCKPCYGDKTGRALHANDEDPQTPQAVRFAQKSFLNLAPPRNVEIFHGCARIAA